jgi:hypothetical protein
MSDGSSVARSFRQSPALSSERTPSVAGEIRFVDPDEAKPALYVDLEPPAGTPRRFATQKVTLSVRDARDCPRLSFTEQGFELWSHPEGILSDFHDSQQIARIYYPAVVRLVLEATGARRVLIFDHTLRSSALRERSEAGIETAVPQAHNDYTVTSGPRRVRDTIGQLAPDESLEAVMRKPHAVINVWRPIRETVEQWPLALCDMRTLDSRDAVTAELKYRHRTGHISVLRYNPEQRWFFAPRMRPDEVLLFVCYDSRGRDGHLFGAHAALKLSSAPRDPRPRESIEVRTVALF